MEDFEHRKCMICLMSKRITLAAVLRITVGYKDIRKEIIQARRHNSNLSPAESREGGGMWSDNRHGLKKELRTFVMLLTGVKGDTFLFLRTERMELPFTEMESGELGVRSYT